MKIFSILLIGAGAMIIVVVAITQWRRRRANDSGWQADAGKSRHDDSGEGMAEELARLSDMIADESRAREAGEATEPTAAAYSEPETATESAPRATSPAMEPPQGDQVVALHVMAPEGERFQGSALKAALEGVGLSFGDMGIFHYCPPGRRRALFSVANTVEPGSFDLEHLESLRTPGVALFMVPAGRQEDVTTFDTMLETAHQLSQRLNAELRDERRCVLTRQAIEHTREHLREQGIRAHAAH